MCSGYRLTPRSASRFPPLSTTRSALPVRPTGLSFIARPRVGSRPGSFKTKATINDGSLAPPPALQSMSFYELLGIPETGSLVDIKQAYKQLARKYHPDVSPPDQLHEYTRKFIRVQEAYETLSDPGRRALYDRDMANGLHFAFSARRWYHDEEQMEEKGEWKSRWESQLSELKRRSMYKDTNENMSWGARMRREKNQSS
ncbi:hypothetical protein RJ639_011085 [Escallonia herrerae]|uniref:J domain-containing protein n=1 Tax=Escallonia herrerae TaxID=1293975 RepID=A0AA89ASF7_9ASTE|nr:hypothetical protein RJ639_011085 [Escallonia herrerae]